MLNSTSTWSAATTINASSSVSGEATPTWEEINAAVRSLLSVRFNQLDLSHIGSNQRLKYEEFESLFYHLFLLIDSQETRRKFKCAPSGAPRSQEDRAKFIELAVRFINDKRLNSQRVATTQLRMCGGEPFRRLIGSLVKIASEREIDSLKKRLPIEALIEIEESGDSSNLRNDLEVLLNKIDEIKLNISENQQNLRDSTEKLANHRNILAEAKQQTDDKWQNLAHKLRGFSSPRDQSQALEMCNNLLSQLETSSAEAKLALEKLDQTRERIEMEERKRQPKTDRPNKLGDNLQVSSEKRLSQFIREAKEQLNPNQDHKDELQRNNIGERIKQQLAEYDEGLARLIEFWREESDRADEMLLKDSDTLERFKQLQKIFPLIPLTPITSTTQSEHNIKELDWNIIAKVLSGNLQKSTQDCRQIIEICQSVFKN